MERKGDGEGAADLRGDREPSGARRAQVQGERGRGQGRLLRAGRPGRLRAVVGACLLRIVAWAIAIASLTGLTDVSTAFAAGPRGIGTNTPAPPRLQELEQKMEALQVSSERFTLKTGITGVKLPGPLSSLLASASGELTTSPPAGNVIFDELGQSLTLRMLGETAYLYVPSISSEDGQRPWVDLGRSPFKELLTPSAKLGGTARPAAPQSPFAGELKLIREASAIREIGPASVDGQEVTRFTAAFNPAKIEKAPRTAAIKTARGRHVAQVPPVKRAGKLELFIAPTGLPVRTVVAITTSGPGGSKRERVTDTVTVDVLAINFPLVVEAPPAAETIALAQLEALERKHARKHHRTRSAKRARPRD